MTSKLYKKVNNQKEDIFENTSNDRRELTEVLTEWSVGRMEGLEILFFLSSGSSSASHVHLSLHS